MATTVRKGQVQDHGWILPLLHTGARAGHFSASVGQQGPTILGCIEHAGALPMRKLRNGATIDRRVTAELWVADWNGAPAAFLICLADADGYELHLSGTRREFQRKGCFKALMQYALGQAPAGKRVFARCYKASIIAIEVLRREGFVITKRGNPDELTLPDRHQPIQLAAPSAAGLHREMTSPPTWWGRVKARLSRREFP